MQIWDVWYRNIKAVVRRPLYYSNMLPSLSHSVLSYPAKGYKEQVIIHVCWVQFNIWYRGLGRWSSSVSPLASLLSTQGLIYVKWLEYILEIHYDSTILNYGSHSIHTGHHTAVVSIPPRAHATPTNQRALTIRVLVTITFSKFAKSSSPLIAAIIIAFLLPPDIISQGTWTCLLIKSKYSWSKIFPTFWPMTL